MGWVGLGSELMVVVQSELEAEFTLVKSQLKSLDFRKRVGVALPLVFHLLLLLPHPFPYLLSPPLLPSSPSSLNCFTSNIPPTPADHLHSPSSSLSAPLALLCFIVHLDECQVVNELLPCAGPNAVNVMKVCAAWEEMSDCWAQGEDVMQITVEDDRWWTVSTLSDVLWNKVCPPVRLIFARHMAVLARPACDFRESRRPCISASPCGRLLRRARL
eukprot:357437-Hanusia_phi.AAC.2